MHSRRLFFASCLSLIATAMAFSIRADIIPELKSSFGFNDTQMGQIVGPGLWGFTITIALGGMLVDWLGMRALMWIAFFGHVLGTVLTIFAQGYASLFIATLCIGLANGLVEAVANPLTATLYPREKTRYLNRLHAWWPGGIVIGGLLSYGLTHLGLGWQVKTALILLPTLAYGYLFLGQVFPQTERVTTGISTQAMFREALHPLFLILLLLMIATTATELGPDQWIGNLLQNLVGIQGVLLLVYTAGIMFFLRQFCAGWLLRILNPIGLLIFASILSAAGLYALGSATSAGTVLAAATLFGLGKAFFWPTMVGTVAERFPRGGSLLMGLMGGMGMFAAGWLMAPAMGSIQDHYLISRLSPALQAQVLENGAVIEPKLEAAHSNDPAARAEIDEAKRYSAEMTFKTVALIPTGLCLAFLLLYLWFHFAQGGYRAVHLTRNGSHS